MGILTQCPRCNERMRVHTGDNDITCGECGRRFLASENPVLDRRIEDPVGGDGVWQ